MMLSVRSLNSVQNVCDTLIVKIHRICKSIDKFCLFVGGWGGTGARFFLQKISSFKYDFILCSFLNGNYCQVLLTLFLFCFISLQMFKYFNI